MLMKLRILGMELEGWLIKFVNKYISKQYLQYISIKSISLGTALLGKGDKETLLSYLSLWDNFTALSMLCELRNLHWIEMREN